MPQLKSVLAAALLAAAAPLPPPPASVAPIVEAERAFAQRAQDKGSAEAFRTFIADDGQMFLPAPTRAKPLLEAGKIPFGPIRWWPAFAGIAASGDLGFTTGPAIAGTGDTVRYGAFFTIWKRQPDGRWRWVMDRGTRQPSAPAQGPEAPVEALPAAAPRKAAPPASQSATAAEARLAVALGRDARAGLLAVMAPGGRLLRDGVPPIVGRAAIAEALAREPSRVETAPLGGAVSAAGDLAWTYGTARWADATGARDGYYVRIWQRRPAGWALIIDETAAPPARKPGAG